MFLQEKAFRGRAKNALPGQPGHQEQIAILAPLVPSRRLSFRLPNPSAACIAVDHLKPIERSAQMSRIRSHGNKTTELRLIVIFKKNGITGWRRKAALPGRPDFVFRNQRLAVFVDGCFWHGCPRCYTPPRNNDEFWKSKFHRNRARDREVNQQLRKLGWRVIRIWEHDLVLKNETRLVARLRMDFPAENWRLGFKRR
jgi:DNA mismatch endonuclease (patch repair protein)